MKFRHSGDAGDIIKSLAILHALGGKHDYFFVDRPEITRPIKNHAPILMELFKNQPYINKVELSEEVVDIDFVPFRRFHASCTTLISAHLSEFNAQAGMVLDVDGSTPWLFAPKSEETSGRVIVARSPRYHNGGFFPWKKIVQHYGDRILFIGLPDEHKRFNGEFGKVEHRKIKDYWELAQLLMGAELLIANQSSPMAVGIGLGVPFIQEVSCHSPDQPDVIYRRTNAQYIPDGSVHLPDIAGSGELKIVGPIPIQDNGNRSIVPPGGWAYPGLPYGPHFSVQQNLVAKLEQCSLVEADAKLFKHNAARVPDFFQGHSNDPLANFKTAYFNAFQKQPIL